MPLTPKKRGEEEEKSRCLLTATPRQARRFLARPRDESVDRIHPVGVTTRSTGDQLVLLIHTRIAPSLIARSGVSLPTSCGVSPLYRDLNIASDPCRRMITWPVKGQKSVAINFRGALL